MNTAEQTTCIHCGMPMEPWEPAAEAGWQNDLLLCTNDHCTYFVQGRRRVCDEYGANFAYRYCYDPARGKAVALAAWCGGHLSLKKGRCVE